MDTVNKFIDIILEFIGFFKFWRVIPINKMGVKIRWGKNPVILLPGFHFVIPFEIDHVKTCVVKPEWVSTHSVHITTTDLKTIVVSPCIKYTIVDPISWLYGENDADTNLHDATRFCTSDILTDCTYEECMKKKTWTEIKNKIKTKIKGLGIEIEDYGVVDLAPIRIIITTV